MDELIGKTVRGLAVNEDQSVLVVQTDDAVLVYQTEGDCCSETWIADIIGVGALLGRTVRKAEAIDLDDPQDGRSRQDSDLVFGWKLTTEAGVCDVIFRNSSNGYYGGSAFLADRAAPDSLTPITSDYQA